MSSLDVKLLRDLTRMRAQLIAIVLVVACGVASFVAMLSVHASFERLAAEYFRGHRFADLFVQVQRAPEAVAGRIADLDGVEAVEARIVRDVTLDVEGLSEPAVGRLISLPTTREPRLHRLHLRQGRMIAPRRTNEVLVNEAFAAAHGLGPGDRVQAVIGGRYQSLDIVGVALSPEYIYQIAPGNMWPDDKRFGVFWMDERALSAAFDMEGVWNDLLIALRPEANLAAVGARVDAIIEPYGGVGSYGRDKQVSARFVQEELEQLRTMGTSVPTIFLGVAAFLLNVVMSRLVGAQREQIAALKALGYGNRAIAVHYAKFVVVVASSGAAAGGLLGALLGSSLMSVYREFFRFPSLDFRLDVGVFAGAFALSLGAGIVGTFGSVRRAVRLPPAEAMRPPAPARYRRSLVEAFGLGRLLSPSARIVLRNLSRHPWRALSSTLGIALAVAILIAGNFSQDALDYVMSVNFEMAQRDDVTVRFDRARPRRAVDELMHVPGVLHAEPVRDVPVRIWAGHRSYETGLQGLPRDGALRRVLDVDLDPVRLPEDGLMVTRELGQRLRLAVGDEVTVEVLEEARPRRTIKIAGFVDEMVGFNAYMELSAVNRLLHEGRLVTGARLLLDPVHRDLAYGRIKHLPYVAGATLRTAAYDIFDESMAQLQLATATILVVFASVVAVGVLYNGARVVLADRSRELASLRVLGFTRVEISAILLGELAVQLVLALPLGCLLGYWFAAGAISGIDAELYRFPLIISDRTYAFAVGVVLVVGVTTALIVRRKLDHLDLVEVLKTKE